MPNLWRCLEDVRGLVAVAAGWRQRVGGDYEALRAAFLVSTGEPAGSFPSGHLCECSLRVVHHSDGSIVGVSECGAVGCRDVGLSKEDVALLEVNWKKLGQAVARAFGCEARDTDLGLPGTRQVGSLGAGSLPVVVTIQHAVEEFRSVVGQLAARLPRPFILLAPTSRFVDGISQGYLTNVKAGFFDLESQVVVLPSGKLHAAKSGGELFAAYLPEKKEGRRDLELKRIIRLYGELLAMGTDLKAAPARVFHLMVFENKSKAETAVACKCVRSLITKRVAVIERHFEMPIEQLSAFASDLREHQRTVKGQRYAKKKRGGIPDEPPQYSDADKLEATEDEDGYLPEERPDYT